jgi:hypothetical protein
MINKNIKSNIFLLIITFFISETELNAEDGQRTCTYQTFNWNINLRKAVAYEAVSRPYNNLTPEETDPASGCTVCKEDQEIIHIQPLAPFLICKKLAPAVKEALTNLIQSGEPIFEVIGYRVGRTRGEADANGNRTGFSNHSYGTAIDINPMQNGLYDNCVNFGVDCKLIRGGPWLQGLHGTLTSESRIVKAMKAAGFQWGGEIKGKQKDFMHFSLTGY